MRLMWTAVAAAALGVPPAALAADLPAQPVYKAPAVVVSTNWTGFYVNGGGGYGMWSADTTTTSVPGLGEPTIPVTQRQGGEGWVARVGGGYDYQFTQRIVGGVFADFDFSDLKGTVQDGIAGVSGDIKQTWSWAAGARAGWLVTPAILTYVNAGFSQAHFSSVSMVSPANFAGSPVPVGAPAGYGTEPFTANGWFLGGGVETALSNGWFWRSEYRYANYSNQVLPDLRTTAANPTPRFNDINFKPAVQTFTTQLVYKFNPGGSTQQITPFPTTAPTRWTGAHIDGGVGYGVWNADNTTSANPASGGEAVASVVQKQGGRGWLGRVGGGYDYQFTSMVVGGVFGDFDFSNLKGTITDIAVPIAGDIKQQWSWAVGARAGLLVTPDILGYVDGGYTSARFSSATMTDPTGTGFAFGSAQGITPAFTQGGWFIGGGTEYALTSFAPGLFLRTEYRYASYGNHVLPDIVAGTPPIPVTQLNDVNFKPRVQTVTSQLVYKFN